MKSLAVVRALEFRVRLTNRGNNVGNNVVFGTLLGQGLGETDLTKLGGRVVRLSEATEETRGGGGVDHAAELLLPEVRPSGTSTLSQTISLCHSSFV